MSLALSWTTPDKPQLSSHTTDAARNGPLRNGYYGFCVVALFNRHRTHAGIEAIPAPKEDSGYVTEKPAGGKLVAIPHMNGLVHELRWAA